jgi:predicted transcriptional regulator
MHVIEAADLLFWKKAAGAPVVDNEGNLVGILTEKDCLRLLTNTTYTTSKFSELAGGKVADYMSQIKEHVNIDDDLFAAAKTFLATNFAVLPVFENGKAVGRLSRQDMLRGIQRLQKNLLNEKKREEERLETLQRPRSISELQKLAGAADRSQMAAVLSDRHRATQ